MSEYILFHAEVPVASLSFSDGFIDNVNEIYNYEHLPSRNANHIRGIKDWWIHRIAKESKENAILSLCNLGLSLSDSYWMMPATKRYEWKNVNLFNAGITRHNPDYSTAGNHRKHWITDNGKFRMIKLYDSIESCCNEVFASFLHQEQSIFPFLNYEISNSNSVICDCFTSLEIEAITVWDAAENHTQDFRQDIVTACVDMGLQRRYVENYLDYIVQADFILGNRSRHPRNISILRNPNTLKAISMAPIYDNGSLFSTKAQKQIYENNFYLLSLTQSVPTLQTSKLPKLIDLKNIFSILESKIRINEILAMYVANITYFTEFYRNIK